MSNTIRVKFERTGPVRYLGHLDMLRYFQKAVMRSGIDVKYSEGFNPHQLMSFAYPLGVSMETLGDYMDLEMNSVPDASAIEKALKEVMCDGIRIVSVSVLPENAINAMASVAAASYLIEISGGCPTKEELDSFLSQEHIFVEKIGKTAKNKGKNRKKDIEEKETKLVDLREGILSLSISDSNYLETTLLSGSAMNIKPSTLIDVINQHLNSEFIIEKIIRTEIYRKNDAEQFVPLGEFHD